MVPTTPYDLTMVAVPIIAALGPIAREHFAADCVCGERVPRADGTSYFDCCNEFSSQMNGANDNAIPDDLEWLLAYAQLHPEVWRIKSSGDTPLVALRRVVVDRLDEIVNELWERLVRELAGEQPTPSEELSLVTLAREVLTRHRAVQLSDGDIVIHTGDCLSSVPTKSEPNIGDSREEWFQYYGPPCQNTRGLPNPYCGGCYDLSRGEAFLAYPCDAARLAMAVLEQTDLSDASAGRGDADAR